MSQNPTSQSPAESAPLYSGLTSEEVAARVAEGRVNCVKEKNGKSYLSIVLTNLLSFFNMVWALIAVVLCCLESYSNLTFLPVIIPNILIAIILECRAKYTVQKLSVTTNPRTHAVRDGALCEIAAADLVVDDVICLSSGQQIPADAVVLSGLAEANESMLTGESNAIRKAEGAELLAGSYLVSGTVYARVTRVGRDNYIHTIEKAAKAFRAPASDLRRDLSRLLRYIAIFMVPMAGLMLLTNYFATEGDLHLAALKTSGSVIGMIPAGLYLLITVTLSLSVIKLSKKRTVIQDMYSIEMLARADVLCLDKTGTITDGTMRVTDTLPLSSATAQEVADAIARIQGAEEKGNATSRALVDAFGKKKDEVIDRVPFSSERKYSAVTFADATYSIGAPHFVPVPVSAELDERIAHYAKEGKRVLLVGRHRSADSEGEPFALVAIADNIRPNAEQVIAGFQSQGVTVKIISGDHAATVSAIAQRVGVIGAENYLSCESIRPEELAAVAERYTVFGRVTPEQKVLLVKRLRELGHTVAMTGDGVNDTLALKESNCAIAMADGSEMAAKVAQIVLLDSDFAVLPDVVREGRRCINNVRMSASLFLMKTILTILLSIWSVVTVAVYPFEPKSMLILEFAIIGIASVLLALEPNNNRIEGSFIKSVIFSSIPSGLGLFLPALVLLILQKLGVIDHEVCSTLSMLSMSIGGYINLGVLCIPYTKWRAWVVGAMGVVSVGVALFTTFLAGDMLAFGVLNGHGAATALTVIGSILCTAATHVVSKIIIRYRKNARLCK